MMRNVSTGNYLPRLQLMKKYDDLANKRMVYVCAPAGFGKTVSVNQWLKQKDADGIVISLDEYDNALSSFCRRLCMALLKSQPGNQPLREYVSHPSFESAAAEYTLRALGAYDFSERQALVLDDLHYITDKEVQQFLPVMVKRLPQNALVVFVSRSEPPESFSQMVMKDEVGFLLANDLRFSGDEIRKLFGLYGNSITEAQAESVYKSTEGWAIGINAWMLSGKEPSSQRRLRRHLGGFLKSQVWDTWDARTQELMLKTAQQEELTPGLCTALTGFEDSAAMLDALANENAFLWSWGESQYRFHHLFRDFLQGLQEKKGEDFRNHQLKLAGDWYLGENNAYRAIEAYAKCNDKAGIAKCFSTFDSNNPQGFLIEKMLYIVREFIGEDIVREYPFLLSMQAWSAFVEGCGREMEGLLDKYYAMFDQIVQSEPRQAINMLFLRCFDYRHSLAEFGEMVASMKNGPTLRAGAGTITQNMPLFHRSSRDFSEFAGPAMEPDMNRLQQCIGDLFGEERYVLEDCVKAGLLYEQGDLAGAYKCALSANSKLQPLHGVEGKFCAMNILAKVLVAKWEFAEAAQVYQKIGEMIEREKAYFLQYNMDACLYRWKMDDGDTGAAREWFEKYGEDQQVTFYKLYGHFTTARAHIVLAQYDNAIFLLSRMLELAQRYRRPIDEIECRILLSIAYWKKKRGFQKEATVFLEEAILLADKYGYTQVFVNEGAELVNMLHRLQNRTSRQDYNGPVSGRLAKMLYMQAYGQSSHARGLTAGQAGNPVKFTAKQKEVMRLLCDGNSYREIAGAMGVKFSTVRSHIELIYKKLDVPNETAAVTKINEMGILND